MNGPGREESSRLQAGRLVTGRAQDRAGGEARSRAGRGGLVELKTKRPAAGAGFRAGRAGRKSWGRLCLALDSAGFRVGPDWTG